MPRQTNVPHGGRAAEVNTAMRQQRIPPAVHWCSVCDEYLNLPVDCDDQGRRVGECPYCGEMIWEAEPSGGYKGGMRLDEPPQGERPPEDGARG